MDVNEHERLSNITQNLGNPYDNDAQMSSLPMEVMSTSYMQVAVSHSLYDMRYAHC
jgi:hypothetical protein